MKKRGLLLFILLLSFIYIVAQEFEKVNVPQDRAKKWLTVGSLNNFFSEYGCEAEESRDLNQQDGMQWPAFYDYQDNQAAKGFWIGAKNVTDANGKTWPVRIAHVGPRTSGVDEFFPVDGQFKLISRFEDPTPTVEGAISKKNIVEIDEIDPTIPCDRMIVNEVNTLLGITMKRKIMQWSQQYNDNYMIMEYEFINTGNVDFDPDIELPDQTLNDVYFFWQYRLSMTYQTRYIVGNASGWGINTMNDARGDGAENITKYGDPESERFRAQFAWHGYYGDKDVAYDNIGAPIWQPDGPPTNYVAPYDTVGRLGAPQFAGVVTIHADKSAADHSDDPEQPSTTAFVGSDEPETSANSNAYNEALMAQEYEWITLGHTERHARIIQPDGNFAAQSKTANISPGEGGGFSFANGYGPYTMAPGDTIRIIMAEAVNGLSRKNCIEIGKQYKDGSISALQKNQAVMTGRDSLFQSFKRAIANYESGYQIEKGPMPARFFDATGGGDKVTLTWELYPEGEADVTGFNIYRSQGRVDAEAELIYTAGPQERSYEDKTALRGLGYYYYIEVIGQPIAANAELGIPASNLKSNRLFSQTFDPVSLKRPPGDLDVFATKNSQVRVVPNPYIEKFRNEFAFSSDPTELGYISFFNIPGECTIDIYTELGEKIYSINHNDGSGDETWKLVTKNNQTVASGIYLAVIKHKDSGKKEIVKFVIVR